jgi:streptogramin lyase
MARSIGNAWAFAICALCGCGGSLRGLYAVPLCDGGACDASSSQGGSSDATSCEGGACDASCAPPTCVSGAPCTLSDPCAVGAIECLGDSPMCIHASNAPDGTSCGNGETCLAGSCGLCADAGEGCTPPEDVCVLGTRFCIGAGTSVCSLTGNVPDGTSCGTGTVCSRGSCVDCKTGAACVPAGNSCDTGVMDCSGGPVCLDTGMPVPNGTACGLFKVCNAGACGDCAAGAACDACPPGTISCTTGVPLCVPSGIVSPDGTVCEDGGVCSQGACTPCGGSCSLTTSPCYSAAISCATGAPACAPVAPLADGTRCAVGGYVCVAGNCEAQLGITPAVVNPDGSRTWSGALANLTDGLQSETAGDFIATISWGDETSDRAAVTGSNGTFTIAGTHTYTSAMLGAIQVTVTVSDTTTGDTVSTDVSLGVGIITFGTSLGIEPRAICAGPDGNLWFTDLSGSVDRITTSGIITEFRAGGTPWYIAPGPDGNVWFTDRGQGAIGQITPSGTITEFSLSALSSPLAITAGSDGNLWFTDTGTNQIGRITPAGIVSEFPIPTANSFPVGIAAGPDGNLWFAEASANQIGRISPSGPIGRAVEFSTASGSPAAIVAGADGSLWFAEGPPSTSLGRMTSAGVMDSIDVGSYNTSSIAAGPDGNIWFSNGPTFGRVTPGGSVATYALPFLFDSPYGPSTISDMVAGPDGNLWLAQSVGISRVLP